MKIKIRNQNNYPNIQRDIIDVLNGPTHLFNKTRPTFHIDIIYTNDGNARAICGTKVIGYVKHIWTNVICEDDNEHLYEITGSELVKRVRKCKAFFSKETKQDKPKKIKETVKVFSKQKTPEKKEVNELISKYGKKTNKGNALILDGTELNTTNTLKKIGFSNKNIYVPNPFEYDIINQKKTSSVFKELLGQFISRAKTRHLTFDVAFFDYMGNFEGTSSLNIYPKNDIYEYFKGGLPNNNSLFAITCSFRSHEKTDYKHEGYAKTLRYIQSVANHFGYQAFFVTHRLYGQMYFLIFQVYKKNAKADTFISYDEY